MSASEPFEGGGNYELTAQAQSAIAGGSRLSEAARWQVYSSFLANGFFPRPFQPTRERLAELLRALEVPIERVEALIEKLAEPF